MKEYSEIERISADRLVVLNKSLFQEKSNWDNILVELEKMFSNIPLNYNNSFVNGEKTYIKFWDLEEFLNFNNIVKSKGEVVWLLNAYPKCCYLLAIIYIERGDFEKALGTLQKGIELEPDNPTLLNEIGFLFTQIGQISNEKNHFNQSTKYYEIAFESRPFNTNSQKARSLRGIGYNLIELEDLENAKKLYEASLTWEESVTARNEIEVIDKKTVNPNSFVNSGTTNFNKAKLIYSYEYFCEQKDKLPSNISERIPNRYVYLWTKAALLHAQGAINFRKDDFFHYPLEEWNNKQIESGAAQITQYLKGITPEHYIMLNTIEEVKFLLMTFHFSLITHQSIINSNGEIINRGEFKHIVDNGEIILFFQID